MTTSFIYDACGKRKYLDHKERTAFLQAAAKASVKVHTFCVVLAYTGARISEVLALTPDRIDFDASALVFECLKKRHRGQFRQVPAPQNILEMLDKVHRVRQKQRSVDTGSVPLWTWGRTTAWRRVKEVMEAANISGPHASPKGLRHSMGVLGLQAGVPLPTLQKWLGHTHLHTTAIYGNATGNEERKIADHFWQQF